MNSIILYNYFLHKELYHIFKRNGFKKKKKKRLRT